MENKYFSKFLLTSRLFRGLALVVGLTLVLELPPGFSALAEQRHADGKTSGKTAAKSAMSEEQRITHVLSRLGFGPRPGDFERVKAVGIAAYIEEQLDPEFIDDTALDNRLAKLSTLALPTPSLLERYNPPKPAPKPEVKSAAKPDAKLEAKPEAKSETSSLKPAMAKEEQKSKVEPPKNPPTAKPPVPQKPAPAPPDPQQIVTELQRAALLRAVYSNRQLYELMVGFWENHFSIFINKEADRFLLTSFDRDTIRPFAMGRFRDLLGATAHSPAMLYYLDNWQSSAPKTFPGTNGKPARTTGGLNENYARELMELHTLGVNGGYTQKDVQEVARCFTGWTIRKPNEEGLFVFNPLMHDNREKVVLGHRIPAGGGISDGERVLDILACHPSTARFIATKLACRLISDNPPPKLVERAAALFLKTDGSIRETLRAIITSPEFFSKEAYLAKVKSPLEYAASALRMLDAETDGDRPILDSIERMGQPIFGKLTPDGYADRADQWLSSGMLIERLNFSVALATNKIKGTSVDLTRLLTGVDVKDPVAVVTRLAQLVLDGNLGPQTREALTKSVRSKSPDAKAPDVLPDQLLALVVGAPEFQRR